MLLQWTANTTRVNYYSGQQILLQWTAAAADEPHGQPTLVRGNVKGRVDRTVVFMGGLFRHECGGL